jgi:hypothetical protein
LVVVLLAAVIAIPRGRVATIKEPVHYDDWFFTVEKAGFSEPARAISPREQALPCDYVVTLRIENRARRVDLRFDPGTLELVDDQGDGRRYRWAPDEGGPASEPDVVVLKAGAAVTHEYHFAVPSNLKSPMLRFAARDRAALFLSYITGETAGIRLP